MLEKAGSTGPQALGFIQQHHIIRAAGMQANKEMKNIISNTLSIIKKLVICKSMHKKGPVTLDEGVL